MDTFLCCESQTLVLLAHALQTLLICMLSMTKYTYLTRENLAETVIVLSIVLSDVHSAWLSYKLKASTQIDKTCP